MGVLVFTKIDDDHALKDVKMLTIVDTFVREDNTTQHWLGGLCYSRKKECLENKKYKITKATKWSIVLEKKRVFQKIKQKKGRGIIENK